MLFFDGNDDEGPIGCNLTDYPGIDVFRSVWLGIRRTDEMLKDLKATVLKNREVKFRALENGK